MAAAFPAPATAAAPAADVCVCLLCSESLPASSGVLCGGTAGSYSDRHFLCKDCLNAYAREQLAGEHANEGKLRCPYVHEVGAGRVDPKHRCPAPPWTAFDLQHMLEPQTFAAMVQGLHQALKLREDIIEQQRKELAEAHKHAGDRHAALARQVADAAGEGTMSGGGGGGGGLGDDEGAQIQRIRQRIIEQVINLHCPRCRTVFVDFVGCEALKCSTCGCAFCALCLVDCGQDAHGHVRDMHGAPFGGPDYFNNVHAHRRLELLQAAVSALDDHGRGFQDALLGALEEDLQGVGLKVGQVRRVGETTARIPAPVAPAPTRHAAPPDQHPNVVRLIPVRGAGAAAAQEPEPRFHRYEEEDIDRLRRRAEDEAILRMEAQLRGLPWPIDERAAQRAEAQRVRQLDWGRRNARRMQAQIEAEEAAALPAEVIERRFTALPAELEQGIQSYLETRLQAEGVPTSPEAWAALLPALLAQPRARLGSKHWQRCPHTEPILTIGVQRHFYEYSLASGPTAAAVEWVYPHPCPQQATCAVAPTCALCLQPLLPQFGIPDAVAHHYQHEGADALHRMYATQRPEQRERAYAAAHRARLQLFARLACRAVLNPLPQLRRPGQEGAAGGAEALHRYRTMLVRLGDTGTEAGAGIDLDVDLPAIIAEELARARGGREDGQALPPLPERDVVVIEPHWAPAAGAAAAGVGPVTAPAEGGGGGRSRGRGREEEAEHEHEPEPEDVAPDPAPLLPEEMAELDRQLAAAQAVEAAGGGLAMAADGMLLQDWAQIDGGQRAAFKAHLQRQLGELQGRPLDEEEQSWDEETLQEAIFALMAD